MGIVLRLPARAEAPPCSPPLLTGPKTVTAGESYGLSWTGVLPKIVDTSSTDAYELLRATDPTFTTLIDKIRTSRPNLTLPAVPSGYSSVAQRVRIVSPTCAAAASAADLQSNVLTTTIRSACDDPDPVEGLVASPAEPPALSTYVISWDTQGSGPGPGGGATGLKFRLKRVAGGDSKESVFDGGSASFQDPPGTYTYQVRAEATCGSAGPWSGELKVVVGAAPVRALTIVSDPKAVASVAGQDFAPSTSFSVRNTGTAALAINTVPGDSLAVSAQGFSLEPGEARTLNVRSSLSYPLLSPYHSQVVLASDAGLLKVPIDLTVAATQADAPVVWSDAQVDVPDDGSPVTRTLVNSGSTRAAIVSSTSVDWIHIDPVDNGPWDRPLLPGEHRAVRINVDRDRRRAPFGTETGLVSIITAGFPTAIANLTVVDDGPAPKVITSVRPSPQGARTRLLYASMPNAKDVLGVGRFTTDLWVTNHDGSSPIEVSIFATKIGAPAGLVISSHIDLTLAPGETRRYRNIVSRLMQYDGACEVEVRSSATTVSATALVANTPLQPAAAQRRSAVRADGAVAVTATPVSPGQYGFEMRPTVPGEGVKATDASFVLSGLAHDAKRRSNLILTETSGVDTTILVSLFDNAGHQVLKDNVPVQLEVTVPALQSVQINDSELFGDNLPASPYALIDFQSGTTDQTTGEIKGSVVPFATVIDAGTQDASLRVGTSVRSLTPVTPPAVASSRRTLATTAALPFGGGPAPLLFPAAHVHGAALADGTVPYWKTRVSFTNVNENESRQFVLRFVGQDGNPVPGSTGGFVALSPKGTFTFDDAAGSLAPGDSPTYGAMVIDNVQSGDGTFTNTWKDVDVQSETYTPDTRDASLGEYKTGMEGFSYRHGYSSFQSNLGTVQIEGAETSSRFRTNLILEEVGGAPCRVAVSAYASGSFVPMATATMDLPAFGYLSKELFASVLGLERRELTDVRVVVRQLDGDGVFMAFASKINLTTGDPANIFLRPASAGTGR